jgi:futalosine hydrolase
MLDQLTSIGTVGSIATVATCSGTDAQSELVQNRTGSICEAMEGAAVVHAANRVGSAAIEIRAISNTTGNRNSQEWDIELALQNLGKSVRAATTCLWGE